VKSIGRATVGVGGGRVMAMLFERFG